MLHRLQVAGHSILQPGMISTVFVHLITVGSPAEPAIRQLIPDGQGCAVVAVGLVTFAQGLQELALQAEELGLEVVQVCGVDQMEP